MVGKLIMCYLALALCVGIAYAADDENQHTCAGNSEPYVGVEGIGKIGSQLCANIAVFEMQLEDVEGAFDNKGIWKQTGGDTFGTLRAVQKDFMIDTYKATYIQFKTPAEHVIRNERASLEMQIYFENDNEDRNDAIFTIPMNHTAPPAYEFKKNASSHTKIDVTFATLETNANVDSTFEFTLSHVSQRINEWPLFYRYTGIDSTWAKPTECIEPITYYVYSSTFFLETSVITAIRALYTGDNTGATKITGDLLADQSVTAFKEFVKGADDNPTFVEYSAGGQTLDSNARDVNTANDAKVIDADLVERFCYREFWRNHIPFNYGLWFALGMLALYFCFQLCTPGDMPIRDPEYQESAKTLHPIYSLWKVSNDIFTRRTRFTILWMNLTNNAIIAAAFITGDHRLSSPGFIEGWEIYCYGLAAAGFGGMATYLWGYFLRKYYICKFKSFQSKGDPAKSDKFNEDANFYLYCFYFMTFAWFWGGNWLFIWMMSRINPKDKIGVTGQSNKEKSIRWIGAFGVSIAMDWLCLDIIFAILGKVAFFRRILRWKGYMYDDLCHKTYLMYSKEE